MQATKSTPQAGERTHRFMIIDSGAGFCALDTQTGKFSAHYQGRGDAEEIARQMNAEPDRASLACWQSVTLIEQPHNVSHPSAVCSSRTGYRPRHKFTEIARVELSKGVYRTVDKCKHCGGINSHLIDYTVLAGIF